MTPQQMRELADIADSLNRDNEWDNEVIAGVMVALRTVADQLEAVRRYAEDRSYHAGRPNNMVSSWRIASDLLTILTADTAPQEGRDE